MTPCHHTRLAIAGLFLVLFAIAGCGKKGPLYIPESPPPAPPAAPATP